MKKTILMLLFSFLILEAQSLSEIKVQSIKNETLHLKELYGQGALLINFWALWCQPCKSELPHLNKLYEKYKGRGITILGINQDTPKSVSKVKSFIASQRIDFPIALDSNFEIFNKFNGQVLPYSLLIDRSGNIVYRHTGYIPGDENAFEKEIINLLNE
ncbi:MAG: TlpA family protein disulfide reductase [Ignavibacteriales bacterium]|nr:TlpA family protein disulfide reductase [Ignavibacteriales bacterium]